MGMHVFKDLKSKPAGEQKHDLHWQRTQLHDKA